MPELKSLSDAFKITVDAGEGDAAGFTVGTGDAVGLSGGAGDTAGCGVKAASDGVKDGDEADDGAAGLGVTAAS